jgi:hypothetical protein
MFCVRPRRQPRDPADLAEIHAFGGGDLLQRSDLAGIEQVLPGAT